MLSPGWVDLGEVGGFSGCSLLGGSRLLFLGRCSRSFNDRFQNGWNFGRNRLLSLCIGCTLGFGCGFGFFGHWSTLLLLLNRSWNRNWDRGWNRNDRNRNVCFLFSVWEELIHEELDELIARGDGSLGILVVEERVLFGDFDDCVDDELLERHCRVCILGEGGVL